MPHVARADKLYAHFNPLPWELGSLVQPELARRLRRRGYAVRQA